MGIRLNNWLCRVFLLLLCLPLLVSSGCWDDDEPQQQEPLELSLFTGIPGVARVGATLQEVTESARFPYTKLDMSDDPTLAKLNFTEALEFKTIGAKVYFKRTGVAMITVQEPFKGAIKNKNISVFSMSVPAVSDWSETLLKELGFPEARASGGRFGSEGLFYSWGDLSYNRTGPNQIALYRDKEIGKYRLTNFGREVQLFPEKK